MSVVTLDEGRLVLGVVLGVGRYWVSGNIGGR